MCKNTISIILVLPWDLSLIVLFTDIQLRTNWLNFQICFFFHSPDAFDTEQLLHCIDTLKSGQPYQIPIYDFKTHQRKSDAFRQVHAFLYIFLSKMYLLYGLASNFMWLDL